MSGEISGDKVVAVQSNATSTRGTEGIIRVVSDADEDGGLGADLASVGAKIPVLDVKVEKPAGVVKSSAILKRGANISAARRAAADAKRKRDLAYVQRQNAGEGDSLVELDEAHMTAATRRNVSQVKERRKERIKWTKSEVLALKKGVQKWGPGKWAVILRDYAHAFHPTRISVDLKDKWRNIFNVPKARGGRRGKKRKKPESSLSDDDDSVAKKAKAAFSRAEGAFPPSNVFASSPEEAEALTAEAHAEAAKQAAAAAEALISDPNITLLGRPE